MKIIVYQIRDGEEERQAELAAIARTTGLRQEQVIGVDVLRHLPIPTTCDAIIVGGSPRSVLDAKELHLRELEYLLHCAHEKKVSILGICFGAQLIASTFGGNVVRDKPNEERGTFLISKTLLSTPDPLFRHLPQDFLAQCSHEDHIVELPEGALPLAYSKVCRIQAFVLRDSRTYGVQFHPERNAADMARSLARHGYTVGTPVQETPDVERLMKLFVEHVVLS